MRNKFDTNDRHLCATQLSVRAMNLSQNRVRISRHRGKGNIGLCLYSFIMYTERKNHLLLLFNYKKGIDPPLSGIGYMVISKGVR